MAIREPAIVAYLVDVFERSWERARPFTNRETSLMKDIAAEQRAMTMRMLIEGHSDPVSAKRLGVSPRTYAGYVADLKDEYEAETRFQLGYTMGSQGSPAPRTPTRATARTSQLTSGSRDTPGRRPQFATTREMPRGQRPNGRCPRVVETGRGVALGPDKWGEIGSPSQALRAGACPRPAQCR